MRIARTERPPENWESLCERDPRATLFLHPRWMRALARAYPKYRPYFLVAQDGGNSPGLLPAVRSRRFGLSQFLSLPQGEPGGPLLADATRLDAGAALVSAFLDGARGAGTLRYELTLLDPPGGLRTALAERGESGLQDSRAHLIDLSGGAQAVRAAYHRNAARSLRASDAAGVKVDRDPPESGIEGLGRLHAAQARNWPGIPPYSLEVLRTVAGEMGKDARLYTARRAGRELASCLCLEHGGREVHPWVSGATPESREVGAFHAVIDAALADAASRGFRVWHFGGSGGNPRIESFKESFGARAVPMLRVFHLAGWARGLRPRPVWDRAPGREEA